MMRERLPVAAGAGGGGGTRAMLARVDRAARTLLGAHVTAAAARLERGCVPPASSKGADGVRSERDHGAPVAVAPRRRDARRKAHPRAPTAAAEYVCVARVVCHAMATLPRGNLTMMKFIICQ
eukprot:5181380-Prymnesium_polylepis.2